MTQSYRIHIELKPKTPVVFSYPDLLKRHEQIVGKIPALSMDLDNEQDSFFKSLLERAAKYDINPDDEEVDSGEEENVTSRDIRGNDYDYEDPFIDDSEMMLDEQYEYVEPEIDGYFVFHGSLDGEAVSNLKKKTKKDKTSTSDDKDNKAKGITLTTNTTGSGSTATNLFSTTQSTSSSSSSSSSSASSSTTRKNNSTTETIEISDTEDEGIHEKSSSPAPSKSKKSSTLDSTKSPPPPPILKRSTSSSTPSSSQDNKKPNKSNKPSSSSSSTITSLSSSITNTNNVNSLQNNNKANKLSNSNNNESRNSENESSSSINSANLAKKKKVITAEDLEPLDPSIEPLIEKLRQDRQKEDFAVKSKFPTTLRPTVIEIGIRMFRLYNKVNDNVINHLMYILPYNRFTLNKFVTTKSGPIVVNEWKQEIEEMTKKLKSVVDDMMPDQIQQYEQKVLEQQSTQQSDEVTTDVEQKFRFNEATKKLIYDILTKDMYSVLISNEVAELTERPDMIASETKARKSMYTKLLSCWPKGWMSTFDISRQYSIMKTSIKMKLKNAEGAASKSNSTISNNPSTFKRPNGSNLKRPAPSSSVNSSISSRNTNTNTNINNNNSQNIEKRKKLNNESYLTVNKDDSNENVTQGLNTNVKENDRELISTYQPSSQPSQRPTSMKIESLISGP